MKNGWFERGTFTGDFLPKLMPHHRQGDLDGACGFYCIAMILDYFEIFDQVEARRRVQRLLSSLGNSLWFTKGLYQKDLLSLMCKTTALELDGRTPPPIDFQKTHAFVQDTAGRAIPGILSYRLSDGKGPEWGHYAVTVGTGKDKIFLMDPALDFQEGSLYNNFLRRSNRGTIKDARDLRVPRIRTCLAINRESFKAACEHWLPRSAS